jgi:hypothetical protein
MMTVILQAGFDAVLVLGPCAVALWVAGRSWTGRTGRTYRTGGRQ